MIFRLVFGLLGVNLLGIDPADILILVLALLLLIFSPYICILNKLSFICRFFMMLFAGFFLLSSYIGFEFRFFATTAINFMSFMLFYFATLQSNKRYALGDYLVVPFIFVNIIFFIIGSLSLDVGSNLFEIFRHGRFLGSMGDPNFTGFFAIFCILFLFDKIIYSSERTAANSLLLLLALVTLILTESRAAWSGALIGGLLYFALMRGKQYKFTIPAISAALVIVMAMSSGNMLGGGQIGGVAERARSIFVQSDNAEAERFGFLYTRAALAVGFDNPLGIGSGNTAAYTGLVSQDGLPIGSHNAFVQIFTEQGWAAFFCLAILLITAVAKLWRRAIEGWMLNDISCRVILSMVAAQVIFAMAHDMIAWRVAWVIPSLAICAAFARETSSAGQMPKARDSFVPAASVAGLGAQPRHRPSYG